MFTIIYRKTEILLTVAASSDSRATPTLMYCKDFCKICVKNWDSFNVPANNDWTRGLMNSNRLENEDMPACF